MTPEPIVTEPSLKPTRKWWVAQVVALASLATMYLTTNAWDTEESVALVALIVQAVSSWLIPNEPTPGGVPLKGD